MNSPAERARRRRGLTSRRWSLGLLALVGCVAAAVTVLATRHVVARASSTPTAHLTPPRSGPQAPRASTGYGRFDVTGSGQINPRVQAQVDRQTGGRLTTIHFYSPSLHRRADYLMFLPAGYTPAERLPVFYLLHGMPGTPMGFTLNSAIEVRLERLIRAHRVKPMILVFPDGRIGGREQSDSEWANTPSGNYQSYVVDVIHNVDSRFGTLPCRQERALAGLSAGAYGAANVGLHEEPLFGLIQVWSGYFTETHNGVFAHADRQVMRYNSPIDYVRTMGGTLRRDPLRIFLYVGRSDPYARQLPGMVAALRREGAHVGSAVYPGGHSWVTWAPHVPQMLEMASRDFARPLAGTAACR